MDFNAIAQLNLTLFAKGEPVIYTVTSEDKKWTASTKITPFPIEVHDKEGHRLSVETISSDGRFFLVSISGFKSLETVELYSQSGRERLQDRFQVSEQGTAQITLMPAVKGKKTGKATLLLKGENQCTLKLNYEWGQQPLKAKGKN